MENHTDSNDSKKKFLISLLIAIVLVILSLGAFFWFKKQRNSVENFVLSNIPLNTGPNENRQIRMQDSNQDDIKMPIVRHKLLLISVDGFPANQFNEQFFPRLFGMHQSGTLVFKSLQSVYPSETTPNHWSMATGLPPAVSGIWNKQFMMADGKMFELATAKEGFWWERAEPIWHAAERQGIRTGVRYWVGSDSKRWPCTQKAPFQVNYDVGSIIHNDLKWLQSMDFVMSYMLNLDSDAHLSGCNSAAYKNAASLIDTALSQLITKYASQLNIVIVSDHGMSPITHRYRLTQFLSSGTLSKCTIIRNSGISTFIYPQAPTDKALIIAEIEASISNNGWASHFRVFDTAINPPANYRIAEHLAAGHADLNSFPPIILEAITVGYIVDAPYHYYETHGWNPQDPAMKGVLLAAGPDFTNQESKDGLLGMVSENIHLYALVCRLLRINDDRPIKPF